MAVYTAFRGKWLKFADFPAPEDAEFSFGTLNFTQVQAILEMPANQNRYEHFIEPAYRDLG